MRDAVRDVFSRREFQHDRPGFVTQARDWVFDQIGRLLADLLQGGRRNIVGLLVFALACRPAVAFLIARFARTVQRDPGATPPSVRVGRRTAADWRADAERYEAAGQWRDGLRCRHRALVADLATRGLVEEVPGRTAGEYRLEVAEAVPVARGAFGGATELFELAWYAHAPTGADESRRFRDLADKVLADTERDGDGPAAPVAPARGRAGADPGRRRASSGSPRGRWSTARPDATPRGSAPRASSRSSASSMPR